LSLQRFRPAVAAKPRPTSAAIRRIAITLLLPLGLASCASGSWWPGSGGDPTDPEAMFARAYWSEAQGATSEAMRDYDDVVERHPGSPLAAVARERLNTLGSSAAGSSAADADPGALAQGDAVCTAPGLYPRDGRWCGIVRKRFDPYVEVEVTHLRFGTIWAIGFSRSVCTGNRFLGYFSYGERVWVPRTCLVTGRI
jgi:hypothetical protein